MKYFLLVAFLSTSILCAQSDPAAGSIDGHVFNSVTGAPLRKASVVLTSPTLRLHLVADTDAEGVFHFTDLPPGTYRLSASRSGFLDWPAHRPIPLSANERVSTAEVRLPPQGVISGHVVDEDGEPVDRVRIIILKQTFQYGKRQWERVNVLAETNDSGEYRVASLRPGRYLLQAHNTRPEADNQYGKPPQAFYVPVYYPNVLMQEQASPIDVGVGAESRNIDIHLVKVGRPPSVHVRGRVTGLPADSPVIVFVGLVSTDGGPFSGGSSLARAPDYAFDLSAAPGQYTLQGNVFSGGSDAYGLSVLNVTGDVAGVAIALSLAPEVMGRVTLAEKDAQANLQGVAVAYTRLTSYSVAEVRSDGAGRFVFPKPIQPGHYTIVSLRSIPDGCFVREIRLGGKEISWDDFELSGPSQMDIVLSNTAGRIGGTVQDAEGKAAPGSTLTLISADGKSRPVKLPANDDGTFQFTGVRPGKYSLFAWEEVDDDLWQDPEFRKNYESRATEITVGPGETQTAQPRIIPAESLK